jgi:hypothetical protein
LVASRRAWPRVSSGRSVAAGGGQQRVHAALHVLRQRAGHLAGDRRHDVARAVGRQLGAEDHGASREVAAQPRGPADDVARLDVRPRAQVLEERAADVLLDLLLGLLDGDVGHRRDRGQVQELARLGAGLLDRADQRDDAEQLVARLDRRLGDDGIGQRRWTAPRALDHRAAQGPQHVLTVPPPPGGAPRRRGAGTTIATGAAGGLGGQLGDPSQPLAAQDRVHHLQVDGPAGARRAPSGASADPVRHRPASPRRHATSRRRPRRPGGPGGPPHRTRPVRTR